MGNNFQCCTDPQEGQAHVAKDIVNYEEEEYVKESTQSATVLPEVADNSFSSSDSLSLSYSPSNATTTTTEINWDLESIQTTRISGGCPNVHPAAAATTSSLIPTVDPNPVIVPQTGKKSTSKTASSSSLWTPLKSKTVFNETAHPKQPKSVERVASNRARVTTTKQRSTEGRDRAPNISSGRRHVNGLAVPASKEGSVTESSESSNAIDDGASAAVGPGRANWPCVGIHAYYHPHYPRKGTSPTSVSPSSAVVSPTRDVSSGSPPVEKSGKPTARTPEHPPAKNSTPNPARKLDFSPPKHSPEAPPVMRRSIPSSMASKSAAAPQTTPRRPAKESPHKETTPNKLAFLQQRQPWKG